MYPKVGNNCDGCFWGTWHSCKSRHRERRNSASDVCTSGRKVIFLEDKKEIKPHILYILCCYTSRRNWSIVYVFSISVGVSGQGPKSWGLLLGIRAPADLFCCPLLLSQAAQKPNLTGEDSVVGNLVEKLFTCRRTKNSPKFLSFSHSLSHLGPTGTSTFFETAIGLSALGFTPFQSIILSSVVIDPLPASALAIDAHSA